jgi:hypothetical protein
MDPHGILIADYIAEGYVLRTSTGYRFKAVQRLSGPPFSKVSHYPYGRRIEASGPNIVVSRCPPPAWLLEQHAARVEDRSKE